MSCPSCSSPTCAATASCCAICSISRSARYCLSCPSFPYPTLSETLTMLAINSEFMFPLVIPFLAMYDGTRGPKTAFSKYFFYVFYPLHLWIIGLIALLVR